MLVHLLKKLLILPVILWVSDGQAQTPAKRTLIEVLSPRGTSIGQPGAVINKHTGNVKLRHQKALLFCDQAVHYVTDNRIEAVGHVLIVQGDTIIVKSDSLRYDGNTQQAVVSGRVTFQDRRIVLTATKLDYNLLSGVAHYTSRGRLVDSRNVLTSREGFYDTRTRQAELQQAVRLVSPESTLTSDVLVYNTVSRLATIVRPTRISGKEGINIAQQGQYDTQSSVLQRSVAEETLKYISADGLATRVAPAEPTLAKGNAPKIATVDRPVSTRATASASPAEKPVLASVATKEGQLGAAMLSVNQTGNTYASISAVPEKLKSGDANLKTAAKKPAGSMRQPVVPAEEEGGVAVMVPTEKPDDQVLLATTETPKTISPTKLVPPVVESVQVADKNNTISSRPDQYATLLNGTSPGSTAGTPNNMKPAELPGRTEGTQAGAATSVAQPVVGAPVIVNRNTSVAAAKPVSAAAAMTRLAVKPTPAPVAATPVAAPEPQKLPVPTNQATTVASVGTTTEQVATTKDREVAPKPIETAPKPAVESPVVRETAKVVSATVAKKPDNQELLTTTNPQKKVSPVTPSAPAVKPIASAGKDSTARARPDQYATQSNALPQGMTTRPLNDVKSTVATSKTADASVAEPLKAPKPVITGQNTPVVTTKKPVPAVITTPIATVAPVAVATPESKKLPASAGQAEGTVANVASAAEKPVSINKVVPKPGEAAPKITPKNPVAVVPEPAKPVKTVSEAAPTKSSEPRLLTTVVSPQKTASAAPVSVVTDPTSKSVTGLRVGVAPAVKQAAAPVARVADAAESDLERELNRKKRVN